VDHLCDFREPLLLRRGEHARDGGGGGKVVGGLLDLHGSAAAALQDLAHVPAVPAAGAHARTAVTAGAVVVVAAAAAAASHIGGHTAAVGRAAWAGAGAAADAVECRWGSRGGGRCGHKDSIQRSD
jgi:hypothetical protein